MHRISSEPANQLLYLYIGTILQKPTRERERKMKENFDVQQPYSTVCEKL